MRDNDCFFACYAAFVGNLDASFFLHGMHSSHLACVPSRFIVAHLHIVLLNVHSVIVNAPRVYAATLLSYMTSELYSNNAANAHFLYFSRLCLFLSMQMAKHAWDNYKLYAWGKNELRPLTKRAHSGSIFGAYELGATIIDSLDSLYIMGLRDEYQEAHDWVARKFAFDMVSDDC